MKEINKSAVQFILVALMSVAIFIWWLQYSFFPLVSSTNSQNDLPENLQESGQEFKDILDQGREYFASSSTQDSLQELHEYYNSTSSTSTDEQTK